MMRVESHRELLDSLRGQFLAVPFISLKKRFVIDQTHIADMKNGNIFERAVGQKNGVRAHDDPSTINKIMSQPRDVTNQSKTSEKRHNIIKK